MTDLKDALGMLAWLLVIGVIYVALTRGDKLLAVIDRALS